jgi:hypothetical protein
VILHKVESMTKVIKGLRKEGMEITDEMLGGIAPYRREHIDLLGKYRLKINKRRSRQALQLSYVHRATDTAAGPDREAVGLNTAVLRKSRNQPVLAFPRYERLSPTAS